MPRRRTKRRTSKAKRRTRRGRAARGHAAHRHREFYGQGRAAKVLGAGGALLGGLYEPAAGFSPRGAAVGGYLGYKTGQLGEYVATPFLSGYEYLYGMKELEDDPNVDLICADDRCDGPQTIHRRAISPTIDVVFMAPSGYILGVVPAAE